MRQKRLCPHKPIKPLRVVSPLSRKLTNLSIEIIKRFKLKLKIIPPSCPIDIEAPKLNLVNISIILARNALQKGKIVIITTVF